MERRLAAILSADVVGYSRMMSADEIGTHDTLRSIWTELVEPYIAKYHGRIVKLTGDGALMEFGSAVDAVHCACAIQEDMAERNKNVPEDRQVQFRIGINVGDIIIEVEDIYGTGVNLAARLQEMADPGGIYVSETVADYVKSLAELSFDYIGERQVKNITDPVVVYRIEHSSGLHPGHGLRRRGLMRGRWTRGRLAGAAAVTAAAGALVAWLVWPQDPAGPPLPDVPSFAVLPFDNFSSDPGQEYLADGITEDLITNLAKVPDFFVIARNSSFVYKDNPAGVKEIGEQLGIRYVVEGSIRRSEDSIRVTAQLIDAPTGRHLWAERYDRPLDEVFEVQDSVTTAIAATISGSTGIVADAELQRVAAQSPQNFGAYDYLVRGWAEWYKFKPESNQEARRLFEKARELDPNYARAYAGLAWTHALDYEYDWTEEYEAAVQTAMNLAREAVRLDDRDYRNYWILGWAHLYSWEHQLALNNYNRALELNPHDAGLLAEMASLLIYTGRPEQAITQLQDAMRRNPLHDRWYTEYLGWAYEEAGQPQLCIDTMKQVIDPVPTDEQLWLLRVISACYAHPEVNRMEDAQAAAEQILKLDPEFSMAKHKAYVEEVFPYEKQEHIDRWIAAFSRVGLPN